MRLLRKIALICNGIDELKQLIAHYKLKCKELEKG